MDESAQEKNIMEDAEDIVFATPENYKDCGTYLSQTLSMHGFIHDFQTDFRTTRDKVAACNCIYDLIRDRQKLQQLREDLTVDVSRTQGRNRDLSRNLEQTKAELIKSRKLQWAAEEKLSLVQKEARAAEKKLKAQVAKLNKENLMIRNRDKGYLAKLRKQEQEAIKLREKLDRAQRARKGLPRNANITVTSSLKSRAKWGSGNGEEDLIRETLQTYERKNQELVAENARLRAEFHMFQEKLDAILQRKSVTIDLSKSMEDALAEFNPCMFDMPYEMVEKYLSNGVNAKLIQLREQIELIDRKTEEINLANAEQLADVVNEQRSMLKETDLLMRLHMFSKLSKEDSKSLRHSSSMSSLKALEEERHEVLQLKERYVRRLKELESNDQTRRDMIETKEKSVDENEDNGLAAYLIDEPDEKEGQEGSGNVSGSPENAAVDKLLIDIENVLQVDDDGMFNEMISHAS